MINNIYFDTEFWLLAYLSNILNENTYVKSIVIEEDHYVYLMQKEWVDLHNVFNMRYSSEKLKYHMGGWFKQKAIGYEVCREEFREWAEKIEFFNCNAEFHAFNKKQNNWCNLGELILNLPNTNNRLLKGLTGFKNTFIEQATQTPVFINGSVKYINHDSNC